MSTDDTGAVQQARLARAGLSVVHLPALTDVDDADDVRTVAAQCPTSRFAVVLSAMVGGSPRGPAPGDRHRPPGRSG